MFKPRKIDIVGWISDHPGLDLLGAALAVSLHVLIIWRFQVGDVLAWTETDRRADLYSQSAAVVTTLGGLSAIGLAIYQSASGGRTRAIRILYGNELRRNWRSLLIMAGASAGISLAAMAIDHDGDPMNARFLYEFAIAFAVCRFMRLIWIFDKILNIADKDLTDIPRPEPAPVTARWRAPKSASTIS